MSKVYSPQELARRRSSAAFIDPGQADILYSADDAILVTEKESCWKTWLRQKVPIYGWLISPGYDLTQLPDDLIAGLTISTVVIPQSMAYAMLAPLPPVYGLYTSVMPILLYCIFGTSRHMHTGTFAISSLLLGQAARELLAKNGSAFLAGAGSSVGSSLVNTFMFGTSSQPTSEPIEDSPEYEQRFIGMVLMLSFVIGFIQVIMSFLRVGGWASKHLLPDALVGGFNTAAVFHIGTSQLKHFLGIKTMPSSEGMFALIKSWTWIGRYGVNEINWYTVALGSSAIVFMLWMRSLEQKRKEAHELELRRKEMHLMQQRQAVSEAIVRNHQKQREQQREQQRRWEELQRRKSDGGISALHSTSASQVANSAPSEISLRTVNDGSVEDGTPSSAVASTSNTARMPRTTSEAELAVSQDHMPMAVEKERDIYIPIPDILLAVIVLTIINVLFSLDRPRSEGGWGISVIGYIPKGLPDIMFPADRITAGPQEWMSWEFIENVMIPMIQPALLIAVIIYVMSFSIAKQFGKRYGYKVDANQEMLALGLASMGGSVFAGYACTGSLTRTAILSQSGGKTPLASIFGVVTVVLTLICLTWCFERVPNAVLAAIVLVALKSLVMQITEPLKLWKLGQRKAALIWIITFAGVLIVSVEIGIAIGIAVVVLTTLYSGIMGCCRGGGEDEPFMGGERRRSSARRMSQGATDALLNDPSAAGASSVSNPNGQRRRSYGGTAHRLSNSASPASRTADWKAGMMRTKWGRRIGSFFGLEQPMFTNARLHTITDEDE
ncbi:hypothetical protein BGX31_006917 [Mortierella sp. GBA43]|nr:hypothetical protein BGX31_006917 [Mortierella sp. GBA43]